MQDFIFKLVEDGTYAIMSYEGDEEVVDIPAFYGGQPVAILYDGLFKGHEELKEVHIPDTVTNIGGFVFDGCHQLKAVKLPAGLQEMWQYAFVRSGIEIVDIPGTVHSVGSFVFQECENLRLVVCHEGTRYIRANAFKDCKNLQMVAVHSATEVSHEAFEGCPMIDPDLRTKLKSTCKCPKCTGSSKQLDVMSLLNRKKK